MKPVLSRVEGTVRCAIYTRKSSEEGLEQAFNSLDAQREACAAYILSQASEGWTALPDIYDDGGLSGGSLERPALQRLLAEVAAGRIDIIVVYKVDRLTRSLLDFSKLVEAFDKAGTSFVSVTQSFNTTTSMGRLTLNMLLSFAQFEREVTAERIRDKIAASKAKGMWMGGIPPLGYKPDGRSLAIVEEHAAIVRRIFERYLELGNVRLLAEQLPRDCITSPVRTTATGKTHGGGAFSRGQLYLMLKCRTYLGEISHRDQVYPGLHKGIVDRDLWDRVQAKLADHVQGTRSGARAARPSLLAGRVMDAEGQALIAAHACKPGRNGGGEGRVRYRYYVSQNIHHGGDGGAGGGGLRIPATELEAAVTERVACAFDDPLALVTTAWLVLDPSQFSSLTERCRAIAALVRRRDRETVHVLVNTVRVHHRRIEIECSVAAIAAALKLEPDADAPPTLALQSDVRLTRSGRAMRLIHTSGASVARQPDRSMVRILVQARGWWKELRAGALDITRLAQREGMTPSYVTRVVRLAFLSPAVVEALLAGTQRAGVDAASLTLKELPPASWLAQQRAYLPAA